MDNVEHHSPASQPWYRKAKFSLRTLLLTVVIAALAVALWKQQREAKSLRNENKQLRDQLGYLTVDDPERIHVRRVRSRWGDDCLWRYRIYLPEKTQYDLHIVSGVILTAGTPTRFPDAWKMNATATRHLKTDLSFSGERTLDLRLFKQKGTWCVAVDDAHESVKDRLKAADWLDDRHMWCISGTGKEGMQKTFAAEDQVTLLRITKGTLTESGGVRTGSGPTDGILVWIEKSDNNRAEFLQPIEAFEEELKHGSTTE